MICSKNSLKREGESCTLNNNCIYPKCKTMKIRFYREDTRWYADIPSYIEEGGNQADLEMVLGADIWLDILSQYGTEITLEISTEEQEDWDFIEYQKQNEFDDMEGVYQDHKSGHLMWLCKITIWLLGNYPDKIYYRKLWTT